MAERASKHDRALTPAERLRALEQTGDPDAQTIARRYKSSPFDPLGGATARQLMRQVNTASTALAPTYAKATAADADEAEAEYAKARARREREARKRDEQLFDFAKSADQREEAMHKLTVASVAIAGVSLTRIVHETEAAPRSGAALLSA